MKQLSKNQRFTIAISIITILLSAASLYLTYFRVSKHLLSVVNSFDINDGKDAKINISFSNTGNQNIVITEIQLIAFFSDQVGSDRINYFILRSAQFSSNTPIYIKPASIQILNVHADVEAFTLNDPSILPFAYTSVYSEIDHHPELFSGENNCGGQWSIDFAFLVTLLDTNGNITNSIMPVSTSCFPVILYNVRPNVIDLLNNKYTITY